MIPKNDPDHEARRVRSRRRKEDDKALRSLILEDRRLSRAMWNAPVVPLKHPYQRGWYRFLKLSERATRRPDFDRLEELLNFVNHKQYCRKKKFLQYCPRQKREVEMTHRPRKFMLWEMMRLKLPDHLFRYFRQSNGFHAINPEMLRELPMRGWSGKIEVNCEHLFESVVAPYIVTHQKVDMPEVRSRLDEIEEFLEQNKGWERYQNLTGVKTYWSYYMKVEHTKLLEHLAEKEMREAKFAFNDGIGEPPPFIELIESKKGAAKVVPFHLAEGPIPYYDHERKNHLKAA